MKNFVLVHYRPLELYPPVQNLINFVSNKFKTIVISTKSELNLDEFNSSNTLVKRFGSISLKDQLVVRLYKYFVFNINTIFFLLLKKPDVVMYYETISSFPVYIYSRFINRKVKVLIHFHEYTSPIEYTQEMRLVRIFHKFEKYLFKNCHCVSHTNKERLDFFLNDHKLIEFNKTFVLPNYPPKSWSKTIQENRSISTKRDIKKIVYVGSIGIKDTYLFEFMNWLIQKQSEFTFDIYSYNIDPNARLFIENYSGTNINFHDGVNYFELPAILGKYDIGIIFYKAHSLNYQYNAPNKLFEYLACNLDVWFSRELLGCQPYQRLLPNRIFEIDFEKQDFAAYNRKMEFSVMDNNLFFSEIVFNSYFEFLKMPQSL